MSAPVTIRIATERDLPALKALMTAAIEELQKGFLTPAEIAASHQVMGIDTQLVRDGTYLIAEIDGQLAGCGGWSFRKTLYGGDHSTALRAPEELDPARDAAKVRAMYTSPDFTRRGVGRAVLAACESAAKDAGFSRGELMGTMAGEPLYRACGWSVIEYTKAAPHDGIEVPLVRMGKDFA